MTMTLQEISDRLEINDLLISYSHAVDTRNFDAFENIFTPDATIDYTAMGGKRLPLKDTIAWLKRAMEPFCAFQHMIANSAINLQGDTATGRTICHNPMVTDLGNGETHTFYCGLWYLDKLVRTPDGWRIAERVEEKSYFHNMPPGHVPVD